MRTPGDVDLARQLGKTLARKALSQLVSQLIKLPVAPEDGCGREGGVVPGYLNLIHLCNGGSGGLHHTVLSATRRTIVSCQYC